MATPSWHRLHEAKILLSNYLGVVPVSSVLKYTSKFVKINISLEDRYLDLDLRLVS